MDIEAKTQIRQKQQIGWAEGKSESQIVRTVLEFYQRVRAPTQNQISKIEKQFSECQKKVLKVVQFRKYLEKNAQINDIQQKYIQKLEQFNEKIIKYEQVINNLAAKCHKKDNQVLWLQMQIERLKNNQISQKKNQKNQKNIQKLSRTVKQLRESVKDFEQQTKKLQNDNQKFVFNNQNNQTQKRDLWQKQIVLESKNQILKMKQEIMQNSQFYKAKYEKTIKETIQVYQNFIKLLIQKQKKKFEQDRSFQLIKSQNEQRNIQYDKLCRESVKDYERQLLKMKLKLDSVQNLQNSSINQKQALQNQILQKNKQLENNEKQNIQLRQQIRQIKQQFQKVKIQLSKKQIVINQMIEQNRQLNQQLNKKINKLQQSYHREKQIVKNLTLLIQNKESENTNTNQLLKNENRLLSEKIKEHKQQIFSLKKNSSKQKEIVLKEFPQVELQEIKQIIQSQIEQQWQQHNQKVELILSSITKMLKDFK